MFDGETDTDAELVRWDSSADYTGVTDQLATRAWPHCPSAASLASVVNLGWSSFAHERARDSPGLHALVRFNGVQNMTRSGFEASYTLQLSRFHALPTPPSTRHRY